MPKQDRESPRTGRRPWIVALLVTGLGGCSQVQDHPGPRWQDGPHIVALSAESAIVVDGKPDEDAWTWATPVMLLVPTDRAASGTTPAEACRARVTRDATHLYFAAACDDTDVVAQGNADQLPQFQFGDVFEVFLRPADQTWYWEFHVTPNGHKTAYFFPGGGHLGLPGPVDSRSEFQVAATVDGTLNNWRDRDRGWAAEIAIPLSELAAPDPAQDPARGWCLLFGRYNYSRYLPHVELTAWPQLSRADFHDHTGHGLLLLTGE